MNELPGLPGFEQTVGRFEAWWTGEVLDRPPVTLHVRSARRYAGPVSNHASVRERWLDAEFQVAAALAHLDCSEFASDNFPCFCPNVGPEITSTLYGCELEFGEHTSWSHPVVHAPDDWDRIAEMAPNFDNPYWRTIERMTDLAIEQGRGRWIVGLTDLHGNYDILAGLRDPQQLCLDLLDCPDRVQRAGRHVSAGFVQAFDRAYRRVAAAGYGSTCWTAAYHRGPAYVPSNDFWCMVSPAMAKECMLPDLLTEMRPLARSIFHLDGPQALKHLDLLLTIPELNAVQWVYGAGSGPATRWVDVYRRILAAGKSAQVICDDPAQALALLEALGPRGVWLAIGAPFDSVADANAFLAEVARRSRR